MAKLLSFLSPVNLAMFCKRNAEGQTAKLDDMFSSLLPWHLVVGDRLTDVCDVFLAAVTYSCSS